MRFLFSRPSFFSLSLLFLSLFFFFFSFLSPFFYHIFNHHHHHQQQYSTEENGGTHSETWNGPPLMFTKLLAVLKTALPSPKPWNINHIFLFFFWFFWFWGESCWEGNKLLKSCWFCCFVLFSLVFIFTNKNKKLLKKK